MNLEKTKGDEETVGKMRGVTLLGDWDPKPEFKLGSKDIDKKQTYSGSKVWRNPRIEILELRLSFF
jgi:hypothetical protein